MVKNIEFSIVFPVMNQEDHIGKVIQSYHKTLTQNGFSFELIAVVNGSSDKSFAICKEQSEKLPNTYSYELIEGGYGLGILHGINKSIGSNICYLNCARIKPKDLINSLKVSKKYPGHIVHGVRIQRENTSRSLGSLIYNSTCRYLFSINTRDINGNPNIFSKKLLSKISLTKTDSMIDLQLLDQGARKHIPIHEVEIKNYERHGGISTSSIATVFRLMKEVVKYRSENMSIIKK